MPDSPPAKPKELWPRVVLVVGIAMVLGYSWMFSDITVPNERTRVYLVTSLVDHGELSIDSAVERFGPTNDWARHEGRYYTDKAPGSSLLGVIPYAVVRMFTAPEDWTIHELVNLQRTFLMIPLSLLGLLILWRILQILQVRPNAQLITGATWLLGTTALHYSTAYYGPQIVAVCLLGALHGLLLFKTGSGPPWRSLLYAGAACGLAGLTEYQAIPLAAILAIFAASAAIKRRAVWQLAVFALGATPFLVAFMVYHSLAFTGPLDLSYNHLVSQAIQAQHERGIGGVGMPHWPAIHGSLFSLHRGLFTTAPVFLLVPMGLVILWRRQRAAAITLSAIFALALLTVFGADVWYAGWSFGPRLLVPIMGLAMIPIGLAIERTLESTGAGHVWRKALVFGVIITGVVYNQVVQSVFAELPESATNPMLDVVLPMLRHDVVSPNVVWHYTGATGWPTLIPLMVLLCAGIAVLAIAFCQTIQGLGARLRFAIIAALIPGLLVALIALQGPRWDQGQTQRWLTLVQNWQEREAILDR